MQSSLLEIFSTICLQNPAVLLCILYQHNSSVLMGTDLNISAVRMFCDVFGLKYRILCSDFISIQSDTLQIDSFIEELLDLELFW